MSDVGKRLAVGKRACQDIVHHTSGRVEPLLHDTKSRAAQDFQIWVGEMLAGFEGPEHNQLVYVALDQSQTSWPFAFETAKTRWHAIGRYTQVRVYMAALTGQDLWLVLPTVIRGKLVLEKATTQFVMQPEGLKVMTNASSQTNNVQCPQGSCKGGGKVSKDANSQTNSGQCPPGGCKGGGNNHNAAVMQVADAATAVNDLHQSAVLHVLHAATRLDPPDRISHGVNAGTGAHSNIGSGTNSLLLDGSNRVNAGTGPNHTGMNKVNAGTGPNHGMNKVNAGTGTNRVSLKDVGIGTETPKGVNFGTQADEAPKTSKVNTGTQTNRTKRLNMPPPRPPRYLSHGYDRYTAPAYEKPR